MATGASSMRCTTGSPSLPSWKSPSVSNGGVPCWRAFGEEIVMADARQHGQFGSGNERRGDFAVGCRQSHLVGVGKQDSHRNPHALEAFRIEALYDARGHHEDGFHSRDAEIVLGVSQR